jgi:autoinducer 2-degrading protein
MSGFAILVRFLVAPDQRSAFLAAVTRNAAASVSNEPGCQRFDILVDQSTKTDEVLLYEIYDNAAAFERHLQTPHFAAFQTETHDWVTSSTLQRLDLREHAKAR